MVEARLLNEDFELAGILDVFESFIWTERFNECGDFEFYAHATPELLNTVHTGMHIQLPDSEYTMIIESVSLDHDYENGTHLTIKGRSLESILDRRIIWEPIIYQNITLGSLIKTIIYNSFIDPEITERRVNNFIFHEPIDSRIENVSFDSVQLFGENVYDVVTQLCQAYKLGFKIIWENNCYVFYLYLGSNRSYSQSINPYIVFSPSYDNILNSNYLSSIDAYKTNCLVGGEGEGEAQTRIEVKLDDNYTGLERRELYADASSISTTNTYNNEPISMEEYVEQLVLTGNEALSSSGITTTFDAQIDPLQLYEYGLTKDYYLGDIVQIVNDFGLESETRVTEYIRSYSSAGIEAYPTFTTDIEPNDIESETIQEGSGGSAMALTTEDINSICT